MQCIIGSRRQGSGNDAGGPARRQRRACKCAAGPGAGGRCGRHPACLPAGGAAAADCGTPAGFRPVCLRRDAGRYAQQSAHRPVFLCLLTGSARYQLVCHAGSKQRLLSMRVQVKLVSRRRLPPLAGQAGVLQRRQLGGRRTGRRPQLHPSSQTQHQTAQRRRPPSGAASALHPSCSRRWVQPTAAQSVAQPAPGLRSQVCSLRWCPASPSRPRHLYSSRSRGPRRQVEQQQQLPGLSTMLPGSHGCRRRQRPCLQRMLQRQLRSQPPSAAC